MAEIVRFVMEGKLEKSGKKWKKVEKSGFNWIELTKNGNIDVCNVYLKGSRLGVEKYINKILSYI